MTDPTDTEWRAGLEASRRSLVHYDFLIDELERRLDTARRERGGQLQVLLNAIENYVRWADKHGAAKDSR